MYADKLITLLPATEGLHPFFSETEGRATLRSHRTFKRGFAEQSRHLTAAPEGRQREFVRYLAKQIVAVAFKKFMLLHGDNDVQVSCLAARHSRFSISRRPKARTIVHARRDAHI